jgi:hypothetical protein
MSDHTDGSSRVNILYSIESPKDFAPSQFQWRVPCIANVSGVYLKNKENPRITSDLESVNQNIMTWIDVPDRFVFFPVPRMSPVNHRIVLVDSSEAATIHLRASYLLSEVAADWDRSSATS